MPNWQDDVDLGEKKAVWTLAMAAMGNDAVGDALCSPCGAFDDALDALLADPANPFGLLGLNLTQAERAFCAGWAYHARKAYPGNGNGQRKQAIRRHLEKHDGIPGDDDCGLQTMSG